MLLNLVLFMLISHGSSLRLRLNYDQLNIGQDNTTIVVLPYNTTNCQKLELAGYSLFDLKEGYQMEPQIRITTANEQFEIFTHDWFNLYFRITARNESNAICSDSHSEKIFYHFNESQHVYHAIPNEVVCFPVPKTNICYHPLLIWPQDSRNDRSCSCIPNDNINYPLSTCARGCQTAYSLEVVNDSVCFYNMSLEMNNTMLHYTCGLDLCASHDCIITFIVSSHKIIIEGTSSTGTTEITESQHEIILIGVLGTVIPFTGMLVFVLLIVLSIYLSKYKRKGKTEELIDNENN